MEQNIVKHKKIKIIFIIGNHACFKIIDLKDRLSYLENESKRNGLFCNNKNC